MITRTTLQRLAHARLQDAQTLWREKRYDAAYYLCGYAIECALKAWIAKQTPRHAFPDKDRVNRAHQHKFSELLNLVDDRQQFEAELKAEERLERAWSLVQDWSPVTRYRFRATSRLHVRAMLDSVEVVLGCLSKFW